MAVVPWMVGLMEWVGDQWFAPERADGIVHRFVGFLLLQGQRCSNLLLSRACKSAQHLHSASWNDMTAHPTLVCVIMAEAATCLYFIGGSCFNSPYDGAADLIEAVSRSSRLYIAAEPATTIFAAGLGVWIFLFGAQVNVWTRVFWFGL